LFIYLAGKLNALAAHFIDVCVPINSHHYGITAIAQGKMLLNNAFQEV